MSKPAIKGSSGMARLIDLHQEPEKTLHDQNTLRPLGQRRSTWNRVVQFPFYRCVQNNCKAVKCVLVNVAHGQMYNCVHMI